MPANRRGDGQARLRNDGGPLTDPVNVRVLRELHADARVSMSALGRAVGLSAPAVTERVQRLVRAGVIAGFRMDVDPAAVGLPVAAFVRVRPGPGQLRKIAELARSLDQVVECYRITGEDCFLMKVHVSAVDELEDVLDRFLLYGQTTSSIVQSAPVPPRPLPLPATDRDDRP
ncbi:MAG: Lrp/AsnC family transcriptional regulator [Streptosporangiales bacterium]|nr:Lrp/AsnC family transcriptional regulator [Streptosporangiales bacterium]MBO0890902.1 Lrp/AsnC family transcriptional regulator [Acidothermales bacterium]